MKTKKRKAFTVWVTVAHGDLCESHCTTSPLGEGGHFVWASRAEALRWLRPHWNLGRSQRLPEWPRLVKAQLVVDD